MSSYISQHATNVNTVLYHGLSAKVATSSATAEPVVMTSECKTLCTESGVATKCSPQHEVGERELKQEYTVYSDALQ